MKAGLQLVILWLIAIDASLQGGRAQETKWWQTATLYQVYPRSLKDTDGDGIGDIKGITESLPHLVDAGVTCVWLSPIYESPMKDFGYDISNFTNIDPIFGTWEDFEELATAVKEAGLKLVMDMVPNHSSDQHEWFQKSITREDPYTDYYIWKPPKGVNASGFPTPPNNWLSAFAGSAWEWNEQRQEFYLHQFTVEQPDLNYRNPLVVEEMKSVFRFWLEQGVDGFRVDAPPHLFEHPDFPDEPPTGDPECPPEQFCQLEHIYTMNQPETLELLKQFRDVVMQYEIETGEVKVMMSEDSNEFSHTMSYYGNATHPIMDFPFNFNFIYDLNNESNAIDIAAAINEWMDSKPEGTTANWVTGNHDRSRLSSRQGVEFAQAMLMMSQLLPGVSVTYYGEEIGMENTFVTWEQTQDPQGCNAGPELYERFSRDPQRTPFQWNKQAFAGFTTGNSTWLPVNDNYITLNLKTQKAAEKSSYKIYQALTTLRRTRAVEEGGLDVRVVSTDVIAFTRELAGTESIVVVANSGYEAVEVDLSHVFFYLPSQGRVHTASLDSNLQAGDFVDFNLIGMPARGGIVILYTPLMTQEKVT